MADEKAPPERFPHPATETTEWSRRKRTGRRSSDTPSEETSLLWLVTFTDIMGLMLTFFVLMFSMTTPETGKFSEMVSGIQGSLNKFQGSPQNEGPEDSSGLSRKDYHQALDTGYLKSLIAETVERNPVLKAALTFRSGGSEDLGLSLSQDFLFQPGQAQMREDSSKALFTLGGSFSRIKNKIEITGYADPAELPDTSDAGRAARWALSLQRAVAVAAVLDKVGYNDPVAVRGHADGLYRELSAAADEKSRLDLSRRLDIDIMNHGLQR